MFLTGTDEHGQKIEDKAKEAGVTPKEFVDNIVEGPRGVLDLWKLMNISNDRFIRTTDDYHELSVQKIFKKLYEKGDIYKGKYVGKYCKPCESFWTETGGGLLLPPLQIRRPHPGSFGKHRLSAAAQPRA